MSKWTHVAAVLRIDNIRITGDQPPDLGTPVQYGDPDEAWQACTVPCGSEGSLHHQMWTNPDDHCLAAYTIMVWGDLRDYSDEAEILAYFNRIISGRMVRQAVVEIAVEGVAPKVYKYDREQRSFTLQTNQI